MTLTVTNAAGDTDVATQTITVTDGSTSCAFDTPIATPLQNINDRYTNVFVLGEGGPSLSNFREFSINWDLQNDGLYEFAMNTTDGQPNWYIDLRDNLTQTFNSASPDAVLAGTRNLRFRWCLLGDN